MMIQPQCITALSWLSRLLPSSNSPASNSPASTPPFSNSPSLNARSVTLVLLTLGSVLGLVGCGGAQAARDKLTRADSVLSSARKLKCPHRSINLAEKAYARSQKLLDEERYDEAERQADVARAHAREAQDSIKRSPCTHDDTTDVKSDASASPEVTPVEVEFQEDANVDPVTPESEEALKTVYFNFNTFSLNAEAREVIDQNLAWIEAHPDQKVMLEGHCDLRGSKEYNLELGDKRARKVADYLEAAGVPKHQLNYSSYGSEQPISYEDNDEGHQVNRRVEFKVARPKRPE